MAEGGPARIDRVTRLGVGLVLAIGLIGALAGCGGASSTAGSSTSPAVSSEQPGATASENGSPTPPASSTASLAASPSPSEGFRVFNPPGDAGVTATVTVTNSQGVPLSGIEVFPPTYYPVGPVCSDECVAPTTDKNGQVRYDVAQSSAIEAVSFHVHDPSGRYADGDSGRLPLPSSDIEVKIVLARNLPSPSAVPTAAATPSIPPSAAPTATAT